MTDRKRKDRPTLEDIEELPRFTYELIDILDASIPHQCIKLGEDPASAHQYAGARKLIDELVGIKEHEQDEERERLVEDQG